MEENLLTPRGIQSLDDVCEIALAKAHKAYEQFWPERENGDYTARVLPLVGRLDKPDVTEPVEILKQFISDEEVEADARRFAILLFVPTIEPRVDGRPSRTTARLFLDEVEFLTKYAIHRIIAPIFCSTAYVYRAQSAHMSRDFNLAWVNAAQSIYWSGIAEASADFGDVITEIRLNERERSKRDRIGKVAHAGGDAKVEKIEKAHEYAFSLVRERMPPSKWGSKNAAAGNILKDVRTFMKDNAIPHKEDADEASARRTIVGWLGDMPDGASYIRNFQSKSRT